MFCPNAPRKYKYLQAAWEAGDMWDNPDTAIPWDPLGGTYCLWWHYIGYLSPGRLFVGPARSIVGRGDSELLVSDFFGYGQCQSPHAFGSCEKFKRSSVAGETWLLSSYWSLEGDFNSHRPDIKLNAGYVDGHVESYSSASAVPMRVSMTSDGSEPYPDGIGPGIFYLPQNGLR